MHRYQVVAFLVSGSLQTTPCAPYPSKQQRPTAWITALRYQYPWPQEFCSAGLCSTTVTQPLPYFYRLNIFFHLPLNPISFWWTFVPIYHFHTYDCFLMGARLTRGNIPVKKLPFENTWQLWIKLELHLWATVRKRTKKSSIPCRFKFGSSGYEPAAEPCYLLRSKLMSITQT